MNSEAILARNHNATHPDSSRISAAFNYARTRTAETPAQQDEYAAPFRLSFFETKRR